MTKIHLRCPMKTSSRIIFITGTPGVGKSTFSKLLEKKLPAHLIKISKLVEDKNLFSGIDREKKYKIVDLDILCRAIKKASDEIFSIKNKKSEIIIVDGHLSHFCQEADMVIVLRTHPSILKKRLLKRGYSDSKILENLEAEAIGVCSIESHELHGNKVHEIDVGKLSPEDGLKIIIDVIGGKKQFPVGDVDFLDWIVS